MLTSDVFFLFSYERLLTLEQNPTGVVRLVTPWRSVGSSGSKAGFWTQCKKCPRSNCSIWKCPAWGQHPTDSVHAMPTHHPARAWKCHHSHLTTQRLGPCKRSHHRHLAWESDHTHLITKVPIVRSCTSVMTTTYTATAARYIISVRVATAQRGTARSQRHGSGSRAQ